jgi:hypothetical protein
VAKKKPSVEDVAMRPPKNALPSHLDAWAESKRKDPEKWAREWEEAKRWYKEEYAKVS